MKCFQGGQERRRGAAQRRGGTRPGCDLRGSPSMTPEDFWSTNCTSSQICPLLPQGEAAEFHIPTPVNTGYCDTSPLDRSIL